jgi:NAD(P)H-hydrate epimerase
MDAATAKQYLSLPRQVLTHKYQQGHLLLICGSSSYPGAAILSGLGARATGVGMLSIAVPESLKSLVLNYLPEAIVIGCPETPSGAISSIGLELAKYQAIACGPGLTTEADAVVKSLLDVDCPLILDADALNIIAQKQLINTISQRQFPTIMTPHLGEFKRLFPLITHPEKDRITAVKQASELSNSIILLKGARTAIAVPTGEVWVIGQSTPALARGGSGDLLTGLLGGLTAQNPLDPQLEKVVATGACWHSQGAIMAAAVHRELGVDPLTLAHYLSTFVEINHEKKENT